MENISTRCVISGGGPAGIMLGYLLARAGIDVVVLEKWPDFFRDFRGDTIHPSVMKLLSELGILDDFLKLKHQKTRRMNLHFGGEEITLVDFSHLNVPAPYIAFIPQWDFLNFISAKAKQYPGFHLMMETEATDIIEEGGRVTGLRVRSKHEEYEIRAELVVGADGRHSTVREKSRLKVEELGVPIDVLWFRIPRAGADDSQSLGYFDCGKVMVMLDRGDYWQCAFIINKGDFDSIKGKGLEAFRISITQLAPFVGTAVNELDSWEKVKLLSVSVDHLLEWTKEGLLMIGDAAHAMSPMGGVGINVALQDAFGAANVLVPAFRAGVPSRETLKAVQKRRESAVRRMQKLQVLLQDRVLFPLLAKKGHTPPPIFIRLFKWIPLLRRIPARIIGIGFQPERVEIEF